MQNGPPRLHHAVANTGCVVRIRRFLSPLGQPATAILPNSIGAERKINTQDAASGGSPDAPQSRTVPTKIQSIADQICHAIRDRKLLMFDYNDQPRVVAPYCYGVSTKNTEVLRAIQVRGGSSSAAGLGKLWALEKMVGLRISDETFVADDPNYNPNDSAMTRIFCRIE